MSDIFFTELGIRKPDLNLNVGSANHGAQTAAMLAGVERAVLEQHPEWVIVYGDTNSTLAGTLAATKLHVPVAHVEAGLRSFNRHMPEEINRLVADTLGSLLFVPSEVARRNLLHEGVAEERICWTGDVMFDSLMMFREPARRCSHFLEELELVGVPFVLCTVHRAENADDPQRLAAIIEGLRRVAKTIRVILPLHPRTRGHLALLPTLETKPVEIIQPLGFLDMIRLEMEAQVIATDSGGVQKEAFFHGVPCVTLREETEWTELVELGWNRLTGVPRAETVAKMILGACGIKGRKAMPYGDGRAAERIAGALGRLQETFNRTGAAHEDHPRRVLSGIAERSKAA